MSITAKQLFINEVSESLGDVLTVNELSKVAGALLDHMGKYDIERLEDEEENKEFEEVLGMFCSTKLLEGRSEKTIERYRYVLSRYREKDKTPLKEITVFNIRRWLSYEKSRGICDNTLRGYRDVLQSFFGWTFREGLIPKNPCANLAPIRCRKEVKLPYSDVDIEKIKESCVTLRDRAIVSFLLSTGCRISEVCGLDIRDIDFQSLECTVLGKGNKERTVYFDQVAAMQLESYLNSRTDDSEALFVGKGTERLHPGGIRKRLNELAAIAGVEHVHPHRFRRTLATNLIMHGMPVQEVKTILGHEKLDTTMTYVYIDKQTVQNSYRKYL